MTLEEAIRTIHPLDFGAMEACRRRWDAIAKPLYGMGLLEDALIRIAGITGKDEIDLSKRDVIVMCADNGVVAEGVTQTSSDVTAIVAENMARGEASVCKMAQIAHAQVFPVDIGIAREVTSPGVIRAKVAPGTANLALGPAMTREQAVKAIETGICLAEQRVQQGATILATGEMGIGNTTTSSAMAAVLLGRPVEEMTGRGAGLSDEGLRKKRQVIGRAIQHNRPDPDDPLDVLAKVGGLDIAGMCGVFLGGAACRTPVLLDGLISGVAALLAARLCPQVKDYLIASHLSREPAAPLILKELELSPLIHAGLSLGEGTGAVAALPLLDMALAVYGGMPTFGEIAVTPYTHFSQGENGC